MLVVVASSAFHFSFFFFSSRRRHTRLVSDWSSDVCSSDLTLPKGKNGRLITSEFLQVEGADSIWAVGDCAQVPAPGGGRSEERRVGKECRSRWSPYH